jgi:hypothetical protein
MPRGSVKGKRPYESFNRSIKKLTDELRLTEQKRHPVHGDIMDFYANRVNDKLALELIEALLARLGSSNMAAVLKIFAGKQSVSSSEVLAEIYGKEFNMDCWGKVYRIGVQQLED